MIKYHKIILCIIVVLFYSTSSLLGKTAASPNEQWHPVFSDKNANYYIEKQSVRLHTNGEFLFIEVWYKSEYTMAGIEDNISRLKNPTPEDLEWAYNLNYVITYAQIVQSKQEYVILKRIFYDRNNKVMKVHEENPDTTPHIKFKPGSPIEKISLEAFSFAYINSKQEIDNK